MTQRIYNTDIFYSNTTSSTTLLDRSLPNLQASLLPLPAAPAAPLAIATPATLLPNPIVPLAPPLPPIDWEPPVRQQEEWMDAPNQFNVVPTVLQHELNRLVQKIKTHQTNNVQYILIFNGQSKLESSAFNSQLHQQQQIICCKIEFVNCL